MNSKVMFMEVFNTAIYEKPKTRCYKTSILVKKMCYGVWFDLTQSFDLNGSLYETKGHCEIRSCTNKKRKKHKEKNPHITNFEQPELH